MGFLCAQFYLKFRPLPEAKSSKGKWQLELGLWLLVLAILLILFSGYIFIKFDFEKPSIWLALYAGVYKNLWILICAGFVCCMCFKVGCKWSGLFSCSFGTLLILTLLCFPIFLAGLAYEFCSLSVFRPLARISFQAFLWHVFVLRIVAGSFRQPVYVNSFFLVCFH